MESTEKASNGAYITVTQNGKKHYNATIYTDPTKTKAVRYFFDLPSAQAALDLASWYTLGYQEGRIALFEQIKEILGVEA